MDVPDDVQGLQADEFPLPVVVCGHDHLFGFLRHRLEGARDLTLGAHLHRLRPHQVFRVHLGPRGQFLGVVPLDNVPSQSQNGPGISLGGEAIHGDAADVLLLGFA